MTADPGDPLEQLREQLERTQEAARALAREAAEAAAGASRRPPAAGWQAPGADEARPAGGELAALLALIETVREALPAELIERVVVVVRELLLAVRALIDYVVERMQAREVAATEVQDIPIL
jgi:hypothetical protein